MVYDIDGNNVITEPKSYRILEYNIANFTGDGTFDGYSGDDLDGYVAEWAKFIGNCNADICLFAESRTYVDSKNTLESKSGLFDKLYKYVAEYGDAVSWRVATLTNVAQLNVRSAKFTNQISGGGSKYITTDITLNGVDICLIIAHFVHGGSANATIRKKQMQELITLSANYDNVIIGGDFNTQDISEVSTFMDAGFVMGNGGIFGEQFTQSRPTPTYPVDNVCVKGEKLRLQSFKVLYDCELSDHYPTITDIIIG